MSNENATRLTDIRQRNRWLFQSAVRAADARFDEQLDLIYYKYADVRDGGHVAQESLEYAIALLETGGDIDRARRIVRATLKYQDLRKHSFTYGNWFWMHNWDTVKDCNAVSFMVPNYWYLLRHYGDELGDDVVSAVIDALEPAGNALLAHRCQWVYGNIFIKNILCKVQIGDLRDDQRMRDLGYYELDEWLSYTNRFGIAEFNSPVYTAVQIRCLEAMLDVPADETFHARVRQLLRWFYTDLLLQYHPQSGLFAGAKSRLTCDMHHTPCHMLLFRQIGRHAPPDSPYNAGYALNEYLVEDDVLALAMDKPLPTRLEQATPHNMATRRMWMTRDYALSTITGGHYGASAQVLEVVYGNEEQSSACALRGDPHIFTLFCEQQENVVVGAVQWRFWPEEDREKVASANSLTHVKVGYGPDYVPPQHKTVALNVVFAPRAVQPEVFVDAQVGDRPNTAPSARTPVVVRVGDVLIGYRSVGARSARLDWIDDQYVLQMTFRAPRKPPWIILHPFLLAVESINDGATVESFMTRMRDARLSASRSGDERRVRCVFGDRTLRATVPLRPAYLLDSDTCKLPQGRVTTAVAATEPLSLWSPW